MWQLGQPQGHVSRALEEFRVLLRRVFGLWTKVINPKPQKPKPYTNPKP